MGKSDVEAVCKGCTEERMIRLGSVLIEKYGIKPYISLTLDQKKLFGKLKKEHPSSGALGIACVSELAQGIRCALSMCGFLG